MNNEFVRFISSLTLMSWMRVVLAIVLTSASVLMAYGVEMGYRLLVFCNVITVSGVFFIEYKNFKLRSK